VSSVPGHGCRGGACGGVSWHFEAADAFCQFALERVAVCTAIDCNSRVESSDTTCPKACNRTHVFRMGRFWNGFQSNRGWCQTDGQCRSADGSRRGTDGWPATDKALLFGPLRFSGRAVEGSRACRTALILREECVVLYHTRCVLPPCAGGSAWHRPDQKKRGRRQDGVSWVMQQ
jgi:hypothetical protein